MAQDVTEHVVRNNQKVERKVQERRKSEKYQGRTPSPTKKIPLETKTYDTKRGVGKIYEAVHSGTMDKIIEDVERKEMEKMNAANGSRKYKNSPDTMGAASTAVTAKQFKNPPQNNVSDFNEHEAYDDNIDNGIQIRIK
eukprot:CAMPEP_0176389210 /NCGR_PEP_ID=MMETSP0126-20121128/38200_1 /TAXON_ID=141414 ORGANISM="Strombidinopsis acuminatum, Strain SPMC142" /NCGR_SAMPLE_ID=MMETSP0126 /ASSEMBLY_ACC=CAM_ASM_000229 /LENGTH=138 /DNA_ID=CAMNT_0017757899 /DNA_START=508 /DNA_END=924 /DNA_ORIENTATION=-